MGASGVEVGGKYVDTEKAREIAVLDPGFTCKRLFLMVKVRVRRNHSV